MPEEQGQQGQQGQQVSAEDLALLGQFKAAIKSNDPMQLEKLALSNGWNEEQAKQNYDRQMQAFEAEEAAKYGMSVDQYRQARMQEAMGQELPQPGMPQGPGPQGYGPQPGAQGVQPPPVNPWAQQPPAWGAPQMAPTQGPTLPDPQLRELADSVNKMRQTQQKEIDDLKQANQQANYEREMANYREYVHSRYDEMKDKLKGLAGEDPQAVVDNVITALQHVDKDAKVGPDEVLVEMNNNFVGRINKQFESQLGTKEKNLPIYQLPKKEGDVPTLGAESTEQGAVGINKPEPKPKEKLAPASSAAAGTNIIEEEVFASDDPRSSNEVMPSQLKEVQEAVSSEDKAQKDVDDYPVGYVDASSN